PPSIPHHTAPQQQSLLSDPSKRKIPSGHPPAPPAAHSPTDSHPDPTTKPPYQPAQDPPNHPYRLVRFVRGAQVPTSPLPHARWTHLSAQSMDQKILHQEKPP